MIQINFSTVDDVVTAVPTGRIDSNNAAEFGQRMLENIEGAKKVVADLSALNYVSSAGLREFLKLQKTLSRQDVPFIVINIRPDIKEIFDVTGFSEILTLE